MDTASGKTNMHVLRVVMLEMALVEQQYNVVSAQLPSFQNRPLSGNDGIDRWSEQSMWDDALRSMNTIVCIHQVLLDALIHGFVHMGKIALLIFDEAPPLRAAELECYQQDAKTKHVDAQIQPPRLLQDLSQLCLNLDIEQDPYVICLREQHFEEYLQVRLSRKTYCQDRMKRLVRTATETNHELGPWTSELHVCLCIIKFRAQRQVACSILEDINQSEKVYLNNLFTSLPAPAIDLHLNLQDRDLSLKVCQLIGLLANEMSPGSAGIVFVKTRATVKLLSVLLTTHPMFKDVLQIGTFVGASNNQARSSNISDLINISD
ncbi:MAG: hypothetical protein Q9167_007750 [Letrouitia subvulpina]